MSRSDLIFDFGDTAGAAQRQALARAGFEAERVILPSGDGFAYERKGSQHYLAIHDIVLCDGELSLDGAVADRTRDLRSAVTFVPAGCPVSGWSRPAARQNSFTALHFDAAELSDELALRYDEFGPAPFVHRRNPALEATLSKLSDVLKPGQADALYAEALCLAAAVEVLQVRPGVAVGLDESRLRLVNDYIAENLHRAISLGELALVAGLSRFHFSRAFKARTGQTPYAFVLSLKLSRARDLLATGNMPIERVATAVGFSSDATFRQAFAKSYGMAPARFRQQARG